MTEDKHKPLEIIENLKLPPPEHEPANAASGRDCPACGARSSKQAGLTHCVYCGHEFSALPPGGDRR